MNPVVKSLLAIAAVSASFAVGFGFKDIRAGRPMEMPMTKVAKDLTPTELFVGEYGRIAKTYSGEMDRQQLLYAGLGGAMQALGDPYTEFFDPIVTNEFNTSTMGQASFGGIGARLMPDPLGVVVTQVFEGSPAESAGIKGGDLIVGVQGETMAGKDSDDIVGKIKGEIGTLVELKILRNNKPLTFKVKRNRIIPPSATGEMLKGSNIGYVLVTGFEAPTPEQFLDSIEKLEDQGMQGLVIDLRNNGGGLLDSAARMLAYFTEGKLVVKMKERGGAVEEVRTPSGLLRLSNYPVAILVNEQSASASEIFAGVMRDYRLGTLVGEHTYGKASVQQTRMLSDGSSAKITIAKYELPSGDNISRKVDEFEQYVSGGIKPDVEVELSLKGNVALGDPKTDNQLISAMGTLAKKNPKVKISGIK